MRMVFQVVAMWLAVIAAARGQGQLGPGTPSGGPWNHRVPRVLTHVPCPAGGERGIAVGVLPPVRPRYTDGAPVVIHVPGGGATGGTEGPPEYAGLGFVEIRFAFPGGGRGDGASGGTYGQGCEGGQRGAAGRRGPGGVQPRRPGGDRG